MEAVATARPSPPGRGWQVYFLLVAVITLLVGSLAAVALQQEKQRYRERASIATQNVARLLDQHINDVIDKIDIVLCEAALDYREHAETGPPDARWLNAHLRQQQAALPEVAALRIADRDGNVRFGGELPADTVNVADREYFTRARQAPAAGLVVAGPLFARISQQWVVVLSRPIVAADGSFAGIVYANLPVSHFERIFASVALGPHGAATIRMADLALVHRHPAVKNAVGSREVSRELRQHLESRPASGEYIAATALDGIERANAYRRLEKHPFYVIVGLATDDYLGGWKSNVLLISVLAVSLVAIAALAARLVYRSQCRQAAEIVHRRQVSEQLEQHRLHLEELVRRRTDELQRSNQQLRQSEEKLRAAFANAAIGFALTGLDGSFLEANPAYCRITGYSADELREKSYLPLIHPDEQEATREAIERMLSSREAGFVAESRYVRKDGDLIWVRESVSTVRDEAGQPRWIIALIEDISERKQAQLLLEGQRDRLEAMVGERTAELTAANRELEGFTYAASHDLKGPLGRINSFSLLLEKQQASRLDDQGLQLLAFIRENAVRLSRLVDDLLLHARLSQLVPELQPVDPGGLAQALLREYRDEILENHAEVSLRLPAPAVLADPQALRQVFANLLENAFKYARAGEPPRIEIGGEVDGAACRLWVKDHGIGFDMRYHDRIFELFRRLHTYQEIPGSGIGLALVKRAMERMGGRVWAESREGEGACFFLELRLAAMPAPQAQESAAA